MAKAARNLSQCYQIPLFSLKCGQINPWYFSTSSPSHQFQTDLCCVLPHHISVRGILAWGWGWSLIHSDALCRNVTLLHYLIRSEGCSASKQKLFFGVSVRDLLRFLYPHPSHMTFSFVHNIKPWEIVHFQHFFLIFTFEKDVFSIHFVIFQSMMKHFSMACKHLFSSQSVSTVHGTLQNSPCCILSSLFLYRCCKITRFYRS